MDAPDATAPAYAPKPGTLGTARAAWALKTVAKALRRPDGLAPAERTFLTSLKRDIGRYKGGTWCADGKWRRLLRIAADLGLPPPPPEPAP